MSNTIHISTIDVKGTIDPMGGEYGKGTVVNSEGNFESAVIRFPSFEVAISPTTKSFEELYSEYKERSEIFGNIKEIERGRNYILYKELRGFAGRKKETYTLLFLQSGKKKTYLLEGKGRMLDPMMNPEDARKALAIARSFVSAD
jgi:hypothetical protein